MQNKFIRKPMTELEKKQQIEKSNNDDGEKSNNKKKNIKEYYLRAFCLLRNDYRFFEVARHCRKRCEKLGSNPYY